MTEHTIYRDGTVHVLAEQCDTCIFNPATRPVPGARVAGMIRDTKDTAGATIVCHSTLYNLDGRDDQAHAICRGWFDRFAHRDPILRLAIATRRITEQPAPEKGTPS